MTPIYVSCHSYENNKILNLINSKARPNYLIYIRKKTLIMPQSNFDRFFAFQVLRLQFHGSGKIKRTNFNHLKSKLTGTK